MIEDVLNSVNEMFQLRAIGLCPFCATAVDPSQFTDELSVREYHISGLCQICQDEFFDEELDDEDGYRAPNGDILEHPPSDWEEE